MDIVYKEKNEKFFVFMEKIVWLWKKKDLKYNKYNYRQNASGYIFFE